MKAEYGKSLDFLGVVILVPGKGVCQMNDSRELLLEQASNDVAILFYKSFLVGGHILSMQVVALPGMLVLKKSERNPQWYSL